MRHPGPIRLAQELTAHIEIELAGHNLGAAASDMPMHAIDRRQALQVFPAQPRHVGVDDLRKFPWHEETATQQICPAVARSVFEQAGVFRRNLTTDQRRADEME